MDGPGWHQPHHRHHRRIQRGVWQRGHAHTRQLLDNRERVLVRPSKTVGYRGEQEELLVLWDPGMGESVGDSRSRVV
jgi:hypothetical protein